MATLHVEAIGRNPTPLFLCPTLAGPPAQADPLAPILLIRRSKKSRTFNVKGHYNQTFTTFNVNGMKPAYVVRNRGNRLTVVRQTWLTEDNRHCAKRVR